MTPMVDLFVGAYGGLFGLRRADGCWILGAPFEIGRQASYGCYDPRRGVHYVVDERDVGEIASFVATGREWRRQSSAPSAGGAPCFACVDAAAGVLVVANYKTGSIAVYRLSDDGSITPAPVVLQGHGSGPVKDRQDGPHAHCARFRGSRLYWTDLGADRVLACRYEPALGVVEAPFEVFAAEPGDGPRHIVFHPTLPRAYLLTELSSRIIVLDVHADGRLTALAGHSTLPAGFAGRSIGGHLALNAADDRLYVSNRGHDSISVFALDDAGDVALQQTVATGGRSPRHFRLVREAQVVLTAHEESDTITVLPLTDDGGLKEPIQQISCPGPVYIGAASLDTAW